MIATHEANDSIDLREYNPINLKPILAKIQTMAVWTFVAVVSSFIFLMLLYAGQQIDAKFNTESGFTFGAIVAIAGICIWKIYEEVRLKMEN